MTDLFFNLASKVKRFTNKVDEISSAHAFYLVVGLW